MARTYTVWVDLREEGRPLTDWYAAERGLTLGQAVRARDKRVRNGWPADRVAIRYDDNGRP